MDPFSAATAAAAPVSPTLIDIPGAIRFQHRNKINQNPETRYWLIKQGAIEIRYGKHHLCGYFIMVLDTRLRLTQEQLELDDPLVVLIIPIAQKYYFAAYTGLYIGEGTRVDVGTMLRLWTLYDVPAAHLTVLDILHRRQAYELNDAIAAAFNALRTDLNAGEDTMDGEPLTGSTSESIETDHIKYAPDEAREWDELMFSNEPLPAAGPSGQQAPLTSLPTPLDKVFLAEQGDIDSFVQLASDYRRRLIEDDIRFMPCEEYVSWDYAEAMGYTDLDDGEETADGDVSTGSNVEVIERDPIVQSKPDAETLSELMMEMIELDPITKSEPEQDGP